MDFKGHYVQGLYGDLRDGIYDLTIISKHDIKIKFARQ